MPRGRPRQFDMDRALDAAMLLFWRHGYEGTSLAALAEAMQLSMPSVYAAFGNKAGLFQQALDRYLQRPASYLPTAMAQPTARRAVEQMFAGAINMVMHKRHPSGCLLVQGALAAGPETSEIRDALAIRRKGAELHIRGRFELAKSMGDLPVSADCELLARYVATVLWGMSVQASGGATRKELMQVAQVAAETWQMLVDRSRDQLIARRRDAGKRANQASIAKTNAPKKRVKRDSGRKVNLK